jgi:hypothetical protein
VIQAVLAEDAEPSPTPYLIEEEDTIAV